MVPLNRRLANWLLRYRRERLHDAIGAPTGSARRADRPRLWSPTRSPAKCRKSTGPNSHLTQSDGTRTVAQPTRTLINLRSHTLSTTRVLPMPDSTSTRLREGATDQVLAFFEDLGVAVEPVVSRLAEDEEALRGYAETTLPQELQAFFSGLEPAIEVARDAQAELDRRLATQWSVFPDFFYFIHKKENTLSRIFANLLDPRGGHGQGSRFLQALLDEAKPDYGGQRNASVRDTHSKCVVSTEYLIRRKQGRGSIDIVLEWPDDYRIGIENKPWAKEQDDPARDKYQVRDYLDALLRLADYEKKRVLLLYFSGNGASPKSVPPTQRDRCITMPYSATVGSPSVEGWLRRCRMVCEAERIRWFLAEIENYIQKEPRFNPEANLNNDQEETDGNQHPA